MAPACWRGREGGHRSLRRHGRLLGGFPGEGPVWGAQAQENEGRPAKARRVWAPLRVSRKQALHPVLQEPEVPQTSASAGPDRDVSVPGPQALENLAHMLVHREARPAARAG